MESDFALFWKWSSESRFIPCSTIELSSRAFRYGIGLFETVRVIDGVPQFLEEHLSQLEVDAGEKRLPRPPVSIPVAELVPAGFTGVMRIYWAAGEGSPADPIHTCDLYVAFEARSLPKPKPHRLAISPDPVHPFGAKTLNYWPNIQALRAARASGADETVLWRWHGNLAEGTASPIVVGAGMANLFWVSDGRLQTPSLATGARAGIIRAWLSKNAEVEEVLVSPHVLEKAQHIFLTNSWLGVVPVEQIDLHQFSPHPQIEAWNRALLTL